jgi:hypothetical protein
MNGFLVQNWGNVASVAGLLVSIWVLIVARKAKQAAGEARSAARLKNLVEVVAEANAKLQQVGTCLAAQQWDVARHLAGEVAGVCRLVKERWHDYMTRSSRGSLLEVSRIAKSIADVTTEANMRQLTKAERREALDSQLAAINLLSSIVGEIRRTEERE